MDQPMYLQRLLRQKYLLIVGLITSVVAGFFAGFSVDEGELVPRATRVYAAAATVLLTSPDPDYFQVEIPRVTQALPSVDPDSEDNERPAQELIVQERQPIDLRANATILAYLASSDQITEAVARAVGGLREQESIVAVSRTTQPAGSERFPGRLSLPIIDIGATALTPDRAELLATEATAAFGGMVAERQQSLGVAEDIRLQLSVLNQPVADDGQGRNPAIPVVVVALGVFMIFVAVALIIEAIRDSRRSKGAYLTAYSPPADPPPPDQLRSEENVQTAAAGEDASARV